MSIHFAIRKGPLRGEKLNVSDGMRVGRENKELSLQDERVSSLHALILKDRKNQYVLIDQKSRNGIKVNGKKVKKLLLLPGVIFQLGGTHIEVKKGKCKEPDRVKVVKERAQPEHQVVLDPHWNSVLFKYALHLSKDLKNKPLQMKPLNPPLRLYFFRGVQVETDWILGYGPRIIGPGALDLTCHEPNTPYSCFEILPTKNGNQFKTSHSKLVKLNGQSVKSDLIKDGDVISFNSTYIKVSYVNDKS